MKVLLVAYLIISIVCAFEKRWPFALYWFSAALITISVLWVGKWK
jgi:hypothetical protein